MFPRSLYYYILTSISVIMPFPDKLSDCLMCPSVVVFILDKDSMNFKLRFCRLSTIQNANINNKQMAVIAQTKS